MQVYFVDAGMLAYPESVQLQEATIHARAKGVIDRDVLFLLQHPPVFTLGQRTTGQEFRKSIETIRQDGIDVCSTNRGGNITYHGPGQVVGYPIIDLTSRTPNNKQEYSRKLEQVMLEAGRMYVPELFCRKDLYEPTGKRYVGVWAMQKEIPVKVGFVGVKIIPCNKCFFSMHGFALNIALQHPEHFELIDPCGLSGVCVASLQDFCQKTISIQDVKQKLTTAFAHVFDYELKEISMKQIKSFLEFSRLSTPLHEK